MTGAAVGVVMLVVINGSWRAAAVASVAAVAVVNVPVLALCGAAVWAVWSIRRRLRRSQDKRGRDQVDLASLCDLTAIALTGGLGLQPALTLAASQVGGDVGTEVADALRRGRVEGLTSSLAATDGVGRRLYRIVARAAAGGTSLLEPVSRLAEDLQAELVASQLEQLRRLPVTMLFPLTMLILPGFLLLAIAPALLDAFDRLAPAPL